MNIYYPLVHSTTTFVDNEPLPTDQNSLRIYH